MRTTLPKFSKCNQSSRLLGLVVILFRMMANDLAHSGLAALGICLIVLLERAGCWIDSGWIFRSGEGN